MSRILVPDIARDLVEVSTLHALFAAVHRDEAR